MTESIEIQPRGPLNAVVRPPGSKSITNRALICAALASGETRLEGVLDSEDTQVMRDAWRRLGLRLQHDLAASVMTIIGCGGEAPQRSAELHLGNSGTSIRFLAAALATMPGVYVLDGVPRMRQRPMRDLLDGIIQLGGAAVSLPETGRPPLQIGPGPLTGGRAVLRGDVSSQFLSGLLMAASYAAGDVELTVEGPLVSRPYVDMTLEVMRTFGVAAEEPQPGVFRIRAGQRYSGQIYSVEPDASAASYFWAAAAITGGRATVAGLHRHSLQGDVKFCDCLQAMGCQVRQAADGITVQGAGTLRGVDVDMNAISDTAPTLAVTALFAEGPTTIRGVAHNRHKETDRIADVARELRKLGAQVAETADGMVIQPGPLRPAEIATYNDHRVAMSFALAGLRQPGVVIQNPSCTAKTYPNFFRDLARCWA